MHLNSELLFRKYAATYFKDRLKVLEIGPAGIPSAYQRLVNNPEIVWHTLDLYQSFPGVTYISTEEYDYPVESESYDIIISGQVIEHVKKIWLWVDELKRLLRKNGTMIIINPVSWPYHAFPVDCWRIFPDGMTALCNQSNLEIVLCKCESIEAEHFCKTMTPTIPGQSYTYLNIQKRIILIKIWNTLIHYFPVIRKLKVPVEVAYDTITVAKKKMNE